MIYFLELLKWIATEAAKAITSETTKRIFAPWLDKLSPPKKPDNASGKFQFTDFPDATKKRKKYDFREFPPKKK